MRTKNQINQREQLEMLTIDYLVPRDHLDFFLSVIPFCRALFLHIINRSKYAKGHHW